MGRDAVTASALILTALAASGGKLPALRATIPAYSMIKRRYALPEGGADELRERLSGAVTLFEGDSVDSRDGLRVEWENRWVHIRLSNTEPIVRIISEALTASGAEELAGQTADRLGLHPSEQERPS